MHEHSWQGTYLCRPDIFSVTPCGPFLQESWIDKAKLIDFILCCQDSEGGGLADQPGNMVDIFHTFFGICGLSLLSYFKDAVSELPASEAVNHPYGLIREVDPSFALPRDVVEKYNLRAQVLPKV
jgi:geranylgeranyl transferase type-2 subunit beta